MAVAEEADVMRSAERARAPASVDLPSTATMPAAARRMYRCPTLNEAPILLTAAYTRGAAAEVADVVGLAEGPAPSIPSSSLLERGLVVPALMCWLWSLRRSLARLLQVGSWLVEASRLIGISVNICLHLFAIGAVGLEESAACRRAGYCGSWIG